MLFEEIDTHFWKKYVFISIDIKGLLSLIQTNKYIYQYRHYIYRLCFNLLLKNISHFDIYKSSAFSNTPEIFSQYVYNYYIHLFELMVRNKILRKWFLNYNFPDYRQINYLVQKIFKTHCLISIDLFIKEKKNINSFIVNELENLGKKTYKNFILKI
tara:strand:- start:36689 stop:37159 length:471 start_codon:yes stop_codon:yes gene_type:complete